MKKITIVLVRPTVDVLYKFSKPVECLALGYLAASLRQDGHQVALVDAMLFDYSIEQTIEAILAHQPDMVGFTNVLNHFPLELEQQVKLLRSKFEGLIVVGGHALSFFPERILKFVPEIDAVICGEGEQSIRDLANRIALQTDWTNSSGVACMVQGTFIKNPPKRIYDLDAIPNPARDLTQAIIDNDGLVCISTSRGCYARCTFCSVPRFYGLSEGKKHRSGSWIARSVDHVVAEITDLYHRFALRELLIVDDEFFGGSPEGLARALEFGQAMEAAQLPIRFTISCRAENVDRQVIEQLIKGGLTHIFVGLESGVDAELKLLGKGHRVDQNIQAVHIIKSLGLSFQPGFMMFNHRSTLQGLKENIAFLKEIGECKPVVINSAVDPHFGSPLTDLMLRENSVEDTGLQMKPIFKDWRVKVAKEVAELCAKTFQPYMAFIAGINSSVTYEWRRQIHGGEVAIALNKLEETINNYFTTVFEEALEDLSTCTIDVVWENTRERLQDIQGKIKLAQAIVIQFMHSKGISIQYYAQKDIIHQNTST